MSVTIAIILSLVALVGGAFAGIFLNKRSERRRIGSAKSQADKILKTAKSESESTHRNSEIEAKEILFRAKSEAERETRDRTKELQKRQERLLKKEENLERKGDLLAGKEREVKKKETELDRREKAAEANAQQAQDQLQTAHTRLEELAAMTRDQARQLLVEQTTEEAKQAAAAQIKEIEDKTEAEAKEKAVTIIANAIQRFASEYVTERTVAVCQLPNDEMKGRIIGREGRNIRALEAATGVDLIIDDTPEAVIISCFHPVRREVARLALTRLIADGRIHPSRIEEVVRRCTSEVDGLCREAGEQAVFDLGLHRVHNELVKLLGQLKFRSSYSQNLLQHSVEVGYIAGIMAAELGLGVKQARRAGLLHDIGKAADHEVEGSHSQVGAELARKYGEKAAVIHAIRAHHGEEEPASVLAAIVDAANRLSAQRPGARKERLNSYVQRLHDLEKISKSFKGVGKVFAIQAGREVRVIVESQSMDDKMSVLLAKDIARKVEEELAYPGQIKVCVIRETRASAVAK